MVMPGPNIGIFVGSTVATIWVSWVRLSLGLQNLDSDDSIWSTCRRRLQRCEYVATSPVTTSSDAPYEDDRSASAMVANQVRRKEPGKSNKVNGIRVFNYFLFIFNSSAHAHTLSLHRRDEGEDVPCVSAAAHVLVLIFALGRRSRHHRDVAASVCVLLFTPPSELPLLKGDVPPPSNFSSAGRSGATVPPPTFIAEGDYPRPRRRTRP